jgi:hypothetical protein
MLILIELNSWRRGAVFGVAFGFLEAAMRAYLRAALGISPRYDQQMQTLNPFSKSIFGIEALCEAATMIMVVSQALLMADVWFPLLVSILTISAVAANARGTKISHSI